MTVANDYALNYGEKKNISPADAEELRSLFETLWSAEDRLKEVKEDVKEAKEAVKSKARKLGQVVSFDGNVIAVRDDGRPRPLRIPELAVEQG